MQYEQLKLLPWSPRLLRVIKRDHRFNRYCNFYTPHDAKDDSLVLVRYTYPTWKRGGEIATAILPDYLDSSSTALKKLGSKPDPEYDLGSICRDGYMVVICPTVQAEIGFECFYESSIELSALKADIIASERGYILDDAFNIPILEAS